MLPARPASVKDRTIFVHCVAQLSADCMQCKPVVFPAAAHHAVAGRFGPDRAAAKVDTEWQCKVGSRHEAQAASHA